MKEDFVTYDIALKLKEKGFREKCLHHYNNNDILKENYSKCYCSSNNIFTDNTVDAPTISQVLKWLREEKKIHISIMLFMFSKGWCYEIVQIVENPKLITTRRNSCNTYEEAALAGIEYVINNLI